MSQEEADLDAFVAYTKGKHMRSKLFFTSYSSVLTHFIRRFTFQFGPRNTLEQRPFVSSALIEATGYHHITQKV